MGKAPKLLKILVPPAYRSWPEFQKLEQQGHTVHDIPEGDWWEYDIVAGPRAHRMNEDIRPWLKEAIAEARRIKYPSKGKGKDNDA